MKFMTLVVAATSTALSSGIAFAADKVVVGYSVGATALPYYVGVEQGIFEKHDLEIEGVKIVVNSNLQSALIANQIDAAAVMLAVEGMAANVIKPGSVNYISLNAQSSDYRMEQFVARPDAGVKELADFKGKKLVTSPGIGNMSVAVAALTAAGLNEGDYTLDQLDTAQHINVLTSGQHDGAFTLEPAATLMMHNGVAGLIKAGVVAEVVLGDPKADAYMAGGAISQAFLTERPDVAKRYKEAFDEAIDTIHAHPELAREALAKYTPTPPEIVNEVPLVKFTKLSDLTDVDIESFQKYIDFAVSIGTVAEPIDVKPFLAKF
ncbi:ABC transporter substrate-binding protein [Celeribacter indicus]|uniref:ABC transporter substrate binding protein n=1 Tax=Celeribacter indicus TaxID=1208324 RepID=A0A0B5E474_9RHOB|nr:ABC transporter substrate-binding protein [Celeribacter indicus]AJE47861.1 ABC transporter substrate binding protein [Celeribacter indicus]SDW25219.1 NitT/TauT family transport system substrate-binding protein [Celeribacter indicus]